MILSDSSQNFFVAQLNILQAVHAVIVSSTSTIIIFMLWNTCLSMDSVYITCRIRSEINGTVAMFVIADLL
jgi:hypothetical protein